MSPEFHKFRKLAAPITKQCLRCHNQFTTRFARKGYCDPCVQAIKNGAPLDMQRYTETR